MDGLATETTIREGEFPLDLEGHLEAEIGELPEIQRRRVLDHIPGIYPEYDVSTILSDIARDLVAAAVEDLREEDPAAFPSLE